MTEISSPTAALFPGLKPISLAPNMPFRTDMPLLGTGSQPQNRARISIANQTAASTGKKSFSKTNHAENSSPGILRFFEGAR